jgi:predicted 3-demethylubiquinone-9 3-methyltransferase (glyoxalase superfamily)
MQRIIPHLWFDNQAEEAAKFYTSIFNNSKIGDIAFNDEANAKVSGIPVGSVLTVEFQLNGFEFVALNGGPVFKPTPAISFFANCKTEEEVNAIWDKLSPGGNALMPLDKYPFSDRYGWIQDKYGISWQLNLCEACEKFIPSLLFVGKNTGRAEEAIKFYISIFKDSNIGDISRYGAGQAPDKEDNINYAEFTLLGQKFAIMESALDHKYNFNEAISLLVNLRTQEEIDYYWEKLSAVPEAEQCGWIKDKYGVSWQIVPVQLNEMLKDPDKDRAERVMAAMLKMKKLNIADLEKAYNQS